MPATPLRGRLRRDVDREPSDTIHVVQTLPVTPPTASGIRTVVRSSAMLIGLTLPLFRLRIWAINGPVWSSSPSVFQNLVAVDPRGSVRFDHPDPTACDQDRSPIWHTHSRFNRCEIERWKRRRRPFILPVPEPNRFQSELVRGQRQNRR